MCGRYYIGDYVSEKLEDITSGRGISQIKTGDVYPSQEAAVLVRGEDGAQTRMMCWGFPQSRGKGLLINARAETAMERPPFRDSIRNRRCVVPASHFYEWDQSRNKVTFCREDSPVLYMAGFYQLFEDKEHFIIVTTKANDSVSGVHDRMPLILEQEELENWLHDDDCLEFLLGRIPAALKKEQEYEQQALPFI